ncbi:MAG: FGGY-family carbohydrate kinase [Candidatus Thorarchaeota archaeon]
MIRGIIMVVAAIDAGTTGVRCMIVDAKGRSPGIARTSWDYITPPDLEIAKEFNPSDFWKLVCTVIKSAIKNSGIKKSDLNAVATTSQRHGLVLLDSNGNELHGCPNIDARGAMTQYLIDESLGEAYHEITGCWPPMMFAPSRLGWFEEEKPEIYEKITHLLPICDWISFRLSEIYATDTSSASATGLLDVRTNEWSEDVLSALNIDPAILPEIRKVGEVIGEVTSTAEKECGLPKGLPVVQGGADTHCALLASQSQVGEITVIAGSTTPVMMVIDSPICVSDQKIWTGAHIIEGQWALESNATLTGAVLEWVIRLLCERSQNPVKCVRKTFDKLDEIVKGIPPGSDETFVSLGPSVMDCQQITDVKLASMIFPQPALPQVIPLNSSRMIHAVLENIAFAMRGNVEQLEKYGQSTGVKTVGGMCQSKTWPQLLANVLNRPIKTPIQVEGSLLGAAICACVGAGYYSSLDDASNAMVRWKQVFRPDDRAAQYDRYYSRWNEITGQGD